MTGIAYAADAAAANGGPPTGAFGGQLFIFIAIFAIFYFLLIRPQQKKAKEHQKFLSELKKGDNVVTNGGIHGEITGLTDKVVTLEIAPNVKIKVSRQYILGSASALASESSEAGKAGGG